MFAWELKNIVEDTVVPPDQPLDIAIPSSRLEILCVFFFASAAFLTVYRLGR